MIGPISILFDLFQQTLAIGKVDFIDYQQPTSKYLLHSTVLGFFILFMSLLVSKTVKAGIARTKKMNRIVQQKEKSVPLLTRKEVEKHNTKDDLWIIIDGKVYDVTKWWKFHPGGTKPIINLGGKDATDVYSVFHPEYVNASLTHYLVGKVETEELSPIQKDFNEMAQQLKDQGYYKTRASYYITKMVLQAAMFITAICCAVLTTNTYINFLGAVLLGCYWHQLSFLAHDLLHNGVTHNQMYDNGIAVILTTTYGVSAAWWKQTHNTHHVVTNSVEYDPDVQHLPVFAISDKFFKSIYSFYHMRKFAFDSAAKFLVSYQHILFYPVMLFARWNLFVQSWIMITKSKEIILFRAFEMTSLGAFWIWYLYVLTFLETPAKMFMFFFVSNSILALLHVQITISHFAMPVYNGIKYKSDGTSADFVQTQLATSLDVDCPQWLDWLHGGLQFQVIHHVFPRLPRHNLREVRDKFLVPFCKKHNLDYNHAGFVACNKKVLGILYDTAIKARNLPADQVGEPTYIIDGLNARG